MNKKQTQNMDLSTQASQSLFQFKFPKENVFQRNKSCKEVILAANQSETNIEHQLDQLETICNNLELAEGTAFKNLT